MQGIYCIENIKSGKRYYGSSMNCHKRLLQHKRDLKNQTHHNVQLQRTYDKHGSDIFKFYVVEETMYESASDLLKYEQSYLDKNINGYNMAPAAGGDCISQHPNKKEIIAKRSETFKSNVWSLIPEERKLKFGKQGSANGNWKNGGISWKICPNCNQNKIRVKSQTCTDCRDRSKENNPFYGKKHSKETIDRLRQQRSENSWIKGINPSELSYTKQYKVTYQDNSSKIVYGLKCIAEEFKVTVECVHSTIKKIKNGKLPTKGVFKDIKLEEC